MSSGSLINTDNIAFTKPTKKSPTSKKDISIDDDFDDDLEAFKKELVDMPSFTDLDSLDDDNQWDDLTLNQLATAAGSNPLNKKNKLDLGDDVLEDNLLQESMSETLLLDLELDDALRSIESGKFELDDFLLQADDLDSLEELEELNEKKSELSSTSVTKSKSVNGKNQAVVNSLGDIDDLDSIVDAEEPDFLVSEGDDDVDLMLDVLDQDDPDDLLLMSSKELIDLDNEELLNTDILLNKQENTDKSNTVYNNVGKPPLTTSSSLRKTAGNSNKEV